MERVEVTTVIYATPETIFEFLVDFPRYARYSEYLKRVRQHGDGEPGTQYELTFAWWKLTYTARSEVTAIDPPHSIDWKVVKDIDATGRWLVEEAPDAAPEGESVASRVRFLVEYDPGSARAGDIKIPRFVSLPWVIEKVKPRVRSEAKRIVERVVADIEGRRRDVDVEIRT
ncbi:type II toxin-antitoxin system RatA family toxin [Haloarchaeobius sp. HRN-SO-5]|uniref:type II toxin-antitoxin system RatA family toxin n=1 Tax=Haloarchaeobius sp. HRN-SO-5 TaxID=3446118 RepID=UPI003EBCE942